MAAAPTSSAAPSAIDVLLVGGTVAHLLEQERAEERHRYRADRHQPDHAQVHRALVQVNGGADGPHHDRGDQVAGDGRGRLDREQQDEHRRHQRAAAGTGQPDQQPHHRATEDDIQAQAHPGAPFVGSAVHPHSLLR
jgi:hypothetical protein